VSALDPTEVARQLAEDLDYIMCQGCDGSVHGEAHDDRAAVAMTPADLADLVRETWTPDAEDVAYAVARLAEKGTIVSDADGNWRLA
jgi:hypothetical protein